MKRKIVAGLAALLLAGSGVVIMAAPASAHTGDLDVSYSCDEATGEYVGTATLTISQTGLEGITAWRVGSPSFEGTPSSNAGLSGALASSGAGQIQLGTFRIPGDTVDNGPWVYAFTIWSDEFSKGSDGQSYETLGGDCTLPEIPEQPEDETSTIISTPVTNCDAGTITTTSVTTRTPYTWDGKSWIAGASVDDEPVVTVVATTVEVCPVTVVPPTEEPPVVTPPVVEPTTALAATGVDTRLLSTIGFVGLTVAGGGTALLLASRRRKIGDES